MTTSADRASRLVTWGLAVLFGAVLAVGVVVVALGIAVVVGLKGLLVAAIVCAVSAVGAVRVLPRRS